MKVPSIKVISYLALGFLVLAVLATVQILVDKEIIAPYLLPSPILVLKTLWIDFPLIAPHLLSTLTITLIGIVLAVVCALLVATTMDIFPLIETLLYPFILVFQIVPFVLFAPMLIIWFGYGSSTQFIAVLLMVFFPLLITIKNGFSNTPSDQISLLHSMNARTWQIYRWIKIPVALSSLFSGLRLAVTYGMTAAVISEWVGAIRGLGVLMIRSQKSFLVARVFAINLLIIIISVLLYLLAIFLEKKALPWKKYI